jgi:hypothetical protein
MISMKANLLRVKSLCAVNVRDGNRDEFQFHLHTGIIRKVHGECQAVNEQFAKGKGCLNDINIEAGGLMRALLDRSGPLYKAVYTQRTCCERINSQAKDLGIERPKARNIRSIRRLNTLIYITINAKALQRARAINASLLTPKLGKVA